MKYELLGNNDLDHAVEQILLNRGIENPDEYLNLSYSVCNDYEHLDRMDEAVECFNNHFEKKNPISILVDNDPDGFTSAAILYKYIKRLDRDYPVRYVLHRRNKSHGLDARDYELLADTKLFIIPDAGTNNSLECNELINQDIDIIILDHHQAEKIARKNMAILVNNQVSVRYTDKEFSGVGVTYEFLRALDDNYLCNYADDFLDLVAFGNISDDMDIRNPQTRYYIETGLSNISNKFLLALNQKQQFSTKGIINIHNILWYWTPICNAMIRLGTSEERDLLFRAFIETDEVFKYQKPRSDRVIDENIYDRVARLCSNIKSKQDRLRDQLFDKLLPLVNNDDKVSILVSTDADSGIVGLTCIKMANAINRPCIIVQDIGNGKFAGSARNPSRSIVDNFKDLVNATELFDFGAGHNNAFGCQIDFSNIELARQAFNEVLKDAVIDDTVYCDFKIDVEDLSFDFFKLLDSVQWLYGPGIDEAKVLVTNIVATPDNCVVRGKNADCVFISLNGIEYCKFKCTPDDQLLKFAQGDDNRDSLTLNIVGTCGLNEYNDNVTPQVIISDLEIL